MAGFRIGRGRDNGSQGPRPQQHPQQQPYGQNPPYGGPPAPPYPQQWPAAGGAPHGGPGGNGDGRGGAHGEPEYFGDPQQAPYPQQGAPHDPFAPNNNPGHTQAFSIGEDPYSQGDTYRAGASAAPMGPRLHWKELLRGIVMRPAPTFLQMRDHAVWGPALVVTFIYGLLAVFGFDTAREDAINATLATSVPIVLTTGVAIVISALVLGAVTHTLARQLGGDGAWQPTVGLSMLIMSITDAPRLVFAMFLGGDAPLVQILGWATWVAAGALFTTMVSKSHDLPWPKALAASSIQLLALLSLIKLGTF
ncbi:Yip1 family protein [Streptomyces cavernicola]|uniref:Yip1 family protein n=1 Tax=Streptomyces cavernicola TaxID=3043613 RepID=A0ABT6SI62_9ACTN|nr:Yip1 family protein [Streptomyces sp. B-S-A6]MDI3407863.1 Yip1 family protein [Streptomyces sp. B-S-A6]